MFISVRTDRGGMHDTPAGNDVLFVDDDGPTRALAREFIPRADASLTVHAAESAEAALAVVDDRRIDCVVTDYRMPGSDGMAFLAALRERDPDLPVIFFTGEGSERIASEAISAGVTDYIRKGSGPGVWELLANRVLSLVKMRRAEAEARRATERVAQVIERVSDAVVSLDDSLTVSYLNEHAETLFGPLEDVLYADLFEAFPELAGGEFERVVRGAAETQRTDSCEVRLPAVDPATGDPDPGADDWIVAVTAYPAEDGVSVFIEDLTESRRLERALEASETKFRVLTTKLARPVSPLH
jgi:FixJ family two-component response regulator